MEEGLTQSKKFSELPLSAKIKVLFKGGEA